MKSWMLSLAVAVCLGLVGAGCGDKGPKITWKETSGTVTKSTDKGDGTCVTEIKYDAGKGPTTTTYLGGKTLPVGQTVKLKYDEGDPNSVQFVDKPE